jgi:NADH:ubiquinone oxidoreductase subunit 4 (subunit M)
MDFPFLTVIALSPIATAILILLLPKQRGENARMLALAAMLMGLILSAYVYFAFQNDLPNPDARWADTLAFVEDVDWIPSVGIGYILGVDGLSATLVLLTSIVATLRTPAATRPTLAAIRRTLAATRRTPAATRRILAATRPTPAPERTQTPARRPVNEPGR